MEELNTDARSLIDAVKQADHPPAGAKEQTWSAVSARIAEGATAATTTASTTGGGGASLGLAGKLVLVAVGAGALALIALRAATPEPAPVPAAPVVVAEPAPAVPQPDPVVPTPVVVPSPAPTPEPTAEEEVPETGAATPTRRRPAKPSVDTLAQEALLLTRLRDATKRGFHDAALSIVAEHGRKYPSGKLAPEFAAQKIMALCGAGRVDSARKAAKRFLRKWPRNPQARLVKQSCAGSG